MFEVLYYGKTANYIHSGAPCCQKYASHGKKSKIKVVRRWILSSPLAPLGSRGTDICACGWNLIPNNFYFKLFSMWYIFLAVLSPTLNVFCHFFLYSIIFQPYQSFEPPSSTLEGDRHMHLRTLLYKIQFRATFILNFFSMWCIFLAALSTLNECSLPFPYRIILRTYPSFKSPSSTLGEIDICARRLFWTKFDSKQLLF